MVSLASHPVLRTVLVGFGAAFLAGGVVLREPDMARDAREVTVGMLSQLGPLPEPQGAIVVDIDSASAKVMGDWPWPRSKLAELIATIAAAHPSAVAVDLVLSGNCGISSPDNQALAAALKQTPVTLGFVMSDQPGSPPTRSPIALRQPVEIPDLWRSVGAEQPCAEFVQAAVGLATVSLVGDH